MKLRNALNDYKHHRGHATRFPGERRSTSGTFSGFDDRLVHVDEDGSLRDYSYPLSGLAGIERSKLGVDSDDGLTWFADAEPVAQSYYEDTAVVETEHDAGAYTVSQYDLTVGDAHLTHVELSGDVPDDASLKVFLGYTPEGQEGQVGRLDHEDAVEVYHRVEHDYTAASTGFEDVCGYVPERLSELVDDAPIDHPRNLDAGRYEDSSLGGHIVVTAPLERDDGVARTTLVTLVADNDETPRADARETISQLAADHETAADVRATGKQQSFPDLPSDTPKTDAVTDDLRVLSLLSATTGARIAGPDFDPFYAYSGGYGYTWFRDDAEISRFLLGTAAELGLSLDAFHDQSAAFYLRTQQDDGTWPHRVWPSDGSLAPGWANARLEAGSDTDYQADQTASVAAFLAAYLDSDPENAADIERALGDALDALDASLEADGLPTTCQNAWENMTGRFVHTAATYLHAFAAIADAPVADDLRDRAAARADEVADALDNLWVEERGIYALREHDGELDDRVDSSSLALAAAYREYAAVADLDAEQLDRLVSHVETTLDVLDRETDAVSGLFRFEGDDWRTRQQPDEKIWTVSTAWGANAAAQLGSLLREQEHADPKLFFSHARDLLDELLPDGSLSLSNSYLPEQVFDDGTPDSATPLGWPHALRLATVAHLHEENRLDAEPEPTPADD